MLYIVKEQTADWASADPETKILAVYRLLKNESLAKIVDWSEGQYAALMRKGELWEGPVRYTMRHTLPADEMAWEVDPYTFVVEINTPDGTALRASTITPGTGEF